MVLPSDLLKYFDITGWSWEERVDKVSLGTLVVELSEKNELRLEGCPAGDYETKDFLPAKRVQDFPLRGHAVFLSISRRRWRHKEHPNDIKSNDYSFIAEGSKFTVELSDFLKYTGLKQG